MKDFLIRDLPRTAIIQGSEDEIASDFRDMLEIEAILASDKSDAEKGVAALQKFYGCVPADGESAVEQLIWFFKGGTEKESNAKELTDKAENQSGVYSAPIYSFSHDGGLIYSAFLAQYGIDLIDTAYLHWWKFISLFNGLSGDHLISEVMHCRAAELKTDMPKEKKDYYQKMKKAYAIPLPLQAKKKLSDLEAALLGDGNVGEVLRGIQDES